MFHTMPEAEMPLLSVFAPNGERSWQWVEFALHIPYFFVALEIKTDGGPCIRNLCVNSFRQIQEMNQTPSDRIRLRYVCLMSPAWMNHHDHYEMDPLKEIWSTPDALEQAYVLADGRRFCYPPSEAAQNTDTARMELVLAL